jgi:virginiamycin B lyase
MIKVSVMRFIVTLTFLVTAKFAWSSTLSGEVYDPLGKRAANAFVTAVDGSRKMSVSVLTDGNGRYSISDLFPEKYEVYARKSGFNDSRTLEIAVGELDGTATLKLEPDDAVHANTLGAEWLNALPNDPQKANFVMACTVCHDPASPAAHVPRDAAAWEATITKMLNTADVYNTGLPVDPKSLAAFLSSRNYGHRAASFDTFSKDANVATSVRISEYRVGDVNSWAHDMAIDPRTGLAWVGDYAKDDLIRVDPRNGEQRVFPAPIKGAGIHTLNFDRDGYLWITMQLVSMVARFDTRTDEWRFYPGFPEHSLNHSFALDSEGYVKKDAKGQIYIGLWGNNKIANLDPQSGQIKTYQLEGRPNGQPYGIAVNSKGVIWYTKYYENKMGYFDPTSGNKKEWSMPRPDSGPHRMHIDNQDNLWIPLSGYGTILRYNTLDGEQKEIKLPDADTFPYALRYDAKSDRVWITGNGGNAIYALNPKTEKFTTFRMPSRLSYGRMISIDYSTGDVWTALSSYPNSIAPRDYSVLVRIHHALDAVR